MILNMKFLLFHFYFMRQTPWETYKCLYLVIEFDGFFVMNQGEFRTKKYNQTQFKIVNDEQNR